MIRLEERVWISALLLGVIALISLLLIFGFERQEYRRYRGFSGEARSNPYLAAQRLLEKQGYRVRNLSYERELQRLSPAVASLTLFDRTSTMDKEQIKAILNWVAAGGHLICSLSSRTEDEDSVGLSRKVLAAAGVKVGELSRTGAAAGDEQLAVNIDRRFRFPTESELTYAWTYPERQEAHIAAFYYGRGQIVAAGELLFARSENIADGENHVFLWSIYDADGQEAWFFKARGYPSLISVLLRRGWMLIFTIFLAATILIAGRSPRFGPVISPPLKGTRGFGEYLQATGRFFAKQNRTCILLREVRAAALENVELHIPGFSRLPLQEQAAILSSTFSLSRETIHGFLRDGERLEEEEFRIYITIAERIRRWKGSLVRNE